MFDQKKMVAGSRGKQGWINLAFFLILSSSIFRHEPMQGSIQGTRSSDSCWQALETSEKPGVSISVGDTKTNSLQATLRKP